MARAAGDGLVRASWVVTSEGLPGCQCGSWVTRRALAARGQVVRASADNQDMGLYTAQERARAQAWIAAELARVGALTPQQRRAEERRLREAVDQSCPAERARAHYKLLAFANLLRLADARAGGAEDRPQRSAAGPS